MLANTREFQRAGLHFLKTLEKSGKGRYTDAPEGTRDYKQFWDEEERRFKHGYSVAGLWIPGKYYYYLNYFPIMKTIKKENGSNKRGVKKLSLPDFWEIQLEWHIAKHIAWYGAKYDATKNKYYSVKHEEVDELVELYNLKYNKLLKRDYLGGEHIVCAKTRGCGFSYMDASEGDYNFNTIRESKSFYIAYDEKYLLGSDGILLKCWEGLNHINENTAFSKKRQVKDDMLVKRASFRLQGDSFKIERGYKSQIAGIIADEPTKVKGARGLKITLEEAGAFPDMYNTLHELKALIQDGSFTIGQISAFGTGNSEEDELKNDINLAALRSIFERPQDEGFIEFINGWEESVNDTCGFFVPSYLADNLYIDKEGNALVEEAIPAWDAKYEKALSSPNPNAFAALTAQYPKYPTHIFNKNTNNILPAQLAREQIAMIKSSRTIQGNIMYGNMSNDGGTISFKPSKDVKPLINYPLKNEEDKTGCTIIYHPPYRNKEGSIPGNLYFIVVDPYQIDDATDKTSLWVATVWQRDNNFTDIKGNRQVAKYVARPKLLTDCYLNTDLLSMYYGDCEIQSEIAGGGKGLYDYLAAKKKLHKVSKEITFDDAKEKKGNNYKYFMAMPTERKKQGLTYYRDFLLTPAFISNDGREILNIHLINDIGELEEIAKYNPQGNFDRISSSILAMFMIKEKIEQVIKEQEKKSDFFSREFFSNPTGNESANNYLEIF